MKKPQSSKIYIFFTLFYAYFTLAIFEAARANFIPFFINEFSVNYSQISFVIALSQIGSIVGCYTAGLFCEKFGQRWTFIVGSTTAFIISLSSLFIGNIYMLILFYFVFNFARSFISISVDSTVPIVSIGYEVLFINLTHFCYGMGSFTGQSFYGQLLFNNISWRHIYFTLSFIFFIGIILGSFLKLPTIHTEKSLNTKVNKKDLFKNPLLIIFIFAMALMSASEGIISTWFINYMNKSYAFNAIQSAKFATIFFISFSLGRLTGGFLFQKIGKIKGLKLFLLSNAIITFFGIFMKENGLILISLSGYFIALGYPTYVIFAAELFSNCPALAIGTITTASAIFYTVITVIVGLLNDGIGSYLAFYLIPLFSLISFILLSILYKKKKIIDTNCK